MQDQMSEEQMQEALDHDSARKEGGNGGGQSEPQPEMTEVSVEQVMANLEAKLAMHAKTVSLSYQDIAQACASLALNNLRPGVEFTQDGQAKPKPMKADPKLLKELLDVAARALDLAREADVLGDRSAARMTITDEPAKV